MFRDSSDNREPAGLVVSEKSTLWGNLKSFADGIINIWRKFWSFISLWCSLQEMQSFCPTLTVCVGLMRCITLFDLSSPVILLANCIFSCYPSTFPEVLQLSFSVLQLAVHFKVEDICNWVSSTIPLTPSRLNQKYFDS